MFKFSGDKQFAAELANQMARELAPKLLGEQKRVLSVNKVTKVVERACELAVAYQNEQKMGYLRRVMLANNFRWAAKDRGYGDDFVNLATESLAIALAKAASKRS
ncbi:MAG: hypothetical protein HZB72_03930 [Burkholderiales bacterium]|nr:hypothetical protein [Burkholderiales bacterium]